MRSRRDILGIVGAVVGVAVIVAACFGVKAVVGDDVSAEAKSVPAGKMAAGEQDLTFEGRMRLAECNKLDSQFLTPVLFVNELPESVKIAAVTDVDPFDWVNVVPNQVLYPYCPGVHSPAASTAAEWGILGLELPPFGEPIRKSLQANESSIGSPFTVELRTSAGAPIGTVKFDVKGWGLLGYLVFRDGGSMQGETRTVGALLVNGQPRTVAVTTKRIEGSNLVLLSLG